MVYNHQTHECIAAQPYTKEFKKNKPLYVKMEMEPCG